MKALALLLLAPLALAQPAASPIIVIGPEQKTVNPLLPDGGLPILPGVCNVQVFRASRDAREQADGKGFTFNHHVDLGYFAGRYYLAWNSTLQNEDERPSRQMYATSTDGVIWSAPAELFPEGISTALRMYFFRAPNGRMLAIAGMLDKEITERLKGPLIVREIKLDHTLGPIQTLIPAATPPSNMPPLYTTSNDRDFVDACKALLDNSVFLEQQDYGNLVAPERRIKWHDPKNWPGGKLPETQGSFWVFGKANCFFHRKDGTLVCVSKMGWATTSTDQGKTWSLPVQPPTLVAGSAKVWGQRTPDGRYALIYNPTRDTRFPLVAVDSDDGITFSNMRVLQAELPMQRYDGKAKGVGLQYMRGISEWASDSSPQPKDAFLVAYSAAKEDIWVSRVPVPMHGTLPANLDETFASAGSAIPGWNIYSPRWAPVRIVDGNGGKCMQLEDRDPYDYARAVRCFAPERTITLTFKLRIQESGAAPLEIELLSPAGPVRPITLSIAPDGILTAADHKIGPLAKDAWHNFQVVASASAKQYTIFLDGRMVIDKATIAQPAPQFGRLSFRTGPYRGVPSRTFAKPGTDKPAAASVFQISEVHLKATD